MILYCDFRGRPLLQAMITILLGIVALAAFVVLFRLLWLSVRPKPVTAIITLATVALVIALAALAATGRLHWLAAAGAAILPFLRRALGLTVRFFPILGRLFSAFRQRRGTAGDGAFSGARRGAMSRDEALKVLGLGANASREEIIDAHRRLMAKNHPDKGGSTYIAQQLNEAKRTLLG